MSCALVGRLKAGSCLQGNHPREPIVLLAAIEKHAGLLSSLVEALSNVALIFMAIIFMLVKAINMRRKVAAELEAGNDYVGA